MSIRTDTGGTTYSDTLVDIQLIKNQQSIDTLRSLSADLQQKGVRSALHVAAKPLLMAMRTMAPNDSQTAGSRLAESINKTIAKPGRKVRTGLGNRVVKAESEELALLVGPNKKVIASSGPYKGKAERVGYIGWFTEKGTTAHDITLKKGKMFHFGFASDRGFVRKKTVSHPGTRGLKWQERALAASQGQMESGFYTGLSKWIEKNGR